VFLGLNGIDFDVPPEEATAVILELASGKLEEESLARWIRDNAPKGGEQKRSFDLVPGGLLLGRVILVTLIPTLSP
jgi:hypothetical protein